MIDHTFYYPVFRFYLRQKFALSYEDVIFIPSALTFDASLLLMFLAWSCCASLVLVSEDILRSPVSLTRILKNCCVTFLQVNNDHYCDNPVVNLFSINNKESTLRLGTCSKSTIKIIEQRL